MGVGSSDDRQAGPGGDAGSARSAGRVPAPGVLLRRLSGPLNALLAVGVARRAEGHIIELLVEREEISEGGMVSVSMYVPVHCPVCDATTAGACVRCGGKRTIDELFSAWLAVPPGVAAGTILVPSALLPGMVHPVSFRLQLRAAP